MNDVNEIGKHDVVVEVRLPLKDYLVMREMIEERQAMNGLKKWLQGKVFWLAGGLLSILGVFEALRRYAL
jgi:hypothetical protein